MSQHYTDPRRASDPYALPDLDTFYRGEYPGDGRVVSSAVCEQCGVEVTELCPFHEGAVCTVCAAGWYYWYCLPGCMPDSDPSGPYTTEADALKAAREDAGYCEHGFDDDTHCGECDHE